jgi:hypothetical protein
VGVLSRGKQGRGCVEGVLEMFTRSKLVQDRKEQLQYTAEVGTSAAALPRQPNPVEPTLSFLLLVTPAGWAMLTLGMGT